MICKGQQALLSVILAGFQWKPRRKTAAKPILSMILVTHGFLSFDLPV